MKTKMRQKLTAFILALCMSIALLPGSVVAVGENAVADEDSTAGTAIAENETFRL